MLPSKASDFNPEDKSKETILQESLTGLSDGIWTLDQLVRMLENNLLGRDADPMGMYRREGPEFEETYKKGHYPYIPLPLGDFMNQMRAIKSLWPVGKPIHFVDVGCGTGVKVKIAQLILEGSLPNVRDDHNSFTGIEINPKYAGVAANIIGSDNVIVRDAKEVDFKRFNLVYFYCPNSNTEFQRKLEKQIFDEVSCGTYFAANMSQNHDVFTNKNPRIKEIKHPLWKKVAQR